MKYYYEMYYNDEFVGTYTAREIADMLGCPVMTARTYADNGLVYKGAYTFDRAENAAWYAEFGRQWDAARAMITKTGRRIVPKVAEP